MGFSLQITWHRQPVAAALPASGSGSSFTNFPVNQQTQHPRSFLSSSTEFRNRACHTDVEKTTAMPAYTRTRYTSTAIGNTSPAAEHIPFARNDRIHDNLGTTSSQKTKCRARMSSPVAGGAHAGGDHSAVPALLFGTDYMPRGGILRRKISKVKSLTEIPDPPYHRRPGHTYRKPRVDGSGNASGGAGAGDPPVVAFSDVTQLRGKRETELSSFIRRKFSFDSFASPVVPEEKAPLISRAASPVISAPFLSESRWSVRESAFNMNSADPSRINGRSVNKTGASLGMNHATYQTPLSPAHMANFDSDSPKLPEISEEKENAHVHACDERSSSHHLQKFGLLSQESSCDNPQPREPIFKATPRYWRNSTCSSRRQTVTSFPKDTCAYMTKPLPPEPYGTQSDCRMIASGWSLTSR